MRIAICLLLASVTLAQDYRGRVQGVVADPSNAAIPQATVTLRNTNTRAATARATDENGRFLFDFVEPGVYTLTAEGSGFGKFVTENLQVLVRSDLTVNAPLRLGDISQTITVADSAVELQFNTTTLSQTIDGKMLKELPVLARNVFTLALLDPAVVNRYSDVSKRNPFYQLSTTGVDVGGQTSGRNEVQIDGSPIGVGSRGSYSPPMDAVQEFTVQQNSVDAESGFSAGGVLNVGMKAGTNEYHGSLYYFGRNPKFNAVSNAFTRSPNLVRNHVEGGTLGAPIIKNKLFTFVTYERWKNRQPYTKVITLPTDLEREGDFSRTLTKSGAMRTIFDPWTTKTADGGVISRTPFAGNRVPASRVDPTSKLFMNDIWKPNGAGDDLTGVNNYRTGYPWFLDYWNISNRTDWNVTPKWKIFARYSVIRTALDNPNYGNSPATTSDNGGLMDALNAAFDSVYTLSAHTVFNFRLGVVYSEDEYDSQWAKLGEGGLAKYWPGNAWYKPYTSDSPSVYYPNLNIGGAQFGKAGWWSYRPRKYSYQGSVGHDRGRHYMKFGAAFRHAFEYSQLPNLGTFPFTANLTAETYNAPNTLLYGSPWASFLLGGIDSSLQANYVSPRYTKQNQYGMFFQDDFKLSRRVTLNLGLRWEYENAPSERLGRMARYLDLNNPIPEFQSKAPVMPLQVAAITGAAKPTYNGAWVYTDDANPGLYKAPHTSFLPRLGIAIRANEKTAIRVGYARYAVPLMSVLGYSWVLPSTDGYSQTSNGPALVQGVPQGLLSNPFPASNPLVLPVGRGNGRNTNLGATGATSWARQDLKIPMNDRFNFTIERDLMHGLKLDATFFMNFGHNMVPEGQGGNAGFGQSLNLVDPQIGYTYKNALSAPVPNPFFGLPSSLMPGQLRGQSTVPLSTLLRPYPQYGDLTQSFLPGIDNRYKALQLRVQRRFASGYSVVWGYNYNREQTGAFFNAPDQYANKLTMIDASLPRHRMTLASTVDLPFGRGRRFGRDSNWVINAILGGWSTSSIYMWNSGAFLRFGQLDVSGEPGVSPREPSKWFDTSVFKQAAPFTPRTNPYQYGHITGPGLWNLDTTLSKNFKLTERFMLEVRFEGYNLTNSVMLGNPNLTVTSTQFGGITSQVNYGREVQYTLRLHF